MKPLYQKALDGTLRSTKTGTTPTTVKFTNALTVKIRPAWIGTDGLITFGADIDPTKVAGYTNSYVGYAYLFVAADSGAFVCAWEHEVNTGDEIKVQIDPTMLCEPNDIGERPEPTKARVIPLDSQPVLVGVGRKETGNNVYVSVSRCQFWRLTQESISLAAGERRVMSFEETNGLQETSSNESTMSTALGFNSTLGWGPISVSLSASMNYSSTTMQQVVISKETTKMQEVTLENKTPGSILYLRWQLMEIVTIFKNFEPVASLVTGVSPTVVSKPYDPGSLPPPPSRKVDRSVVPPTLVAPGERRSTSKKTTRKPAKRARR